MGDESKCPVPHDQREKWLEMSRKSGIQNEVSKDNNIATQERLSEDREISTIPRTATNDNWIYPSEKQFYDAMKHKNWNPKTDDMQVIVPLHNSINERVWNCVKRWEHGNESAITLTNFKNNSKKMTPRAWIRSRLMGLDAPFDRHDWTIDRKGKTIDYVIDFYYGEAVHNTEPQVYLDVRPKINSFEGIKLRVWKFFGLN